MNRRTFLKQASLFGLAVAATGLGCTPGAVPMAAGSDVTRSSAPAGLTVGTLLLMPYRLDDDAWMPCEGQILPIGSNQALFSVLGKRFGGDGTTTFALPDLRQASPGPGVAYHLLTRGPMPSNP
jgi:hypothetical protein